MYVVRNIIIYSVQKIVLIVKCFPSSVFLREFPANNYRCIFINMSAHRLINSVNYISEKRDVTPDTKVRGDLSRFHAVSTRLLQFPHIMENKLDISLLSVDSERRGWISEIARAIAGTKWNTEFITGMCLSNYTSMYRTRALLIGFVFMPRNGIDTVMNFQLVSVVPTLTVRSVALMWTDCTKAKMLIRLCVKEKNN